jgi:hypothetical protein
MEPKHGAKMPANAATVFKQIKEMAELKLVPTQKLIEKIKWLNKLARSTSALWHAGFYMASVLVVGVIIALLILLQKLFDYCEFKFKIHKVVLDKVKRKLMFSTMIRSS